MTKILTSNWTRVELEQEGSESFERMPSAGRFLPLVCLRGTRRIGAKDQGLEPFILEL